MISKLKLSINFLIVAILLTLVGCSDSRPVHKKPTVHTTVPVQVYRQQTADDTWVFWYIMYLNNNTYYASSSTALQSTQLSSASFTRVAGSSLPANVSSQVKSAEQLEQEQVEPDQLPEQVQQDADQQMEADTQAEAETAASETSSESSGASDSSSSSESSSGGDSGSSGDGGGGGGE